MSLSPTSHIRMPKAAAKKPRKKRETKPQRSKRILTVALPGMPGEAPRVPKRYNDDPEVLGQLYRRIITARFFGHKWLDIGKALKMSGVAAQSLKNINPALYASTYQQELSAHVKQDIATEILAFDMRVIREGQKAMDRYTDTNRDGSEEDPDAQPASIGQPKDNETPETKAKKTAKDRFLIQQAAKTSADLKGFIRSLVGSATEEGTAQKEDSSDGKLIDRLTGLLNAETARLVALGEAANAQRGSGSPGHAALRGNVDGNQGAEVISGEFTVSADDSGEVSGPGRQEAPAGVQGNGEE